MGGILEKIMMFLVATIVVASQLPKRRQTGTPTTRANILVKQLKRLKAFRKKLSIFRVNLFIIIQGLEACEESELQELFINTCA